MDAEGDSTAGNVGKTISIEAKSQIEIAGRERV